MVWEGGRFALKSIMNIEHSNSYWGPVIYPVKIFIPFGGFLVLIQGLAKIGLDLITAITGREAA